MNFLLIFIYFGLSLDLFSEMLYNVTVYRRFVGIFDNFCKLKGREGDDMCRRSNGHFGVRGVGDESDLWHSISSLRVIIFFAAGHRLPSAVWNRPYRSGWSAGGRCPSARF